MEFPRRRAKRFERKIYVGMGLLVLGFLPVLIFAFYSLGEIVSERKQVVLHNAEELVLAERLSREFNAQQALVPVYVLSGNRSLLDQIHESETKVESVLGQLYDLAASAEERIEIMKIRRKASELKGAVDEGARLKAAGKSRRQLQQHFSSISAPVSFELREMLAQFASAKAEDLAEARDRLNNHTNNLVTGLLLVTALATFFVGLISWLLVRLVRTKRRSDEEQDRIFLHELHLSNARKEAVETVAHDLKNPLSSMSLRMELLRRKLTQDAPALTSEIEKLQRVSDSMSRLIQDFLDHAKIEAGKLLLVHTHCDPNAILKEILETLQPLAQAKQIELVISPTGELPSIQCDYDRIVQALENLVGNSIKFTPAGGTITLQAVRNNQQLVFSVSDTGPGIPQEKLKNIFDRYWQDESAARQGTGLGLAIVSGIAKAHGGNVFAESRLGKGTSVHLWIPIWQGAKEEELLLSLPAHDDLESLKNAN